MANIFLAIILGCLCYAMLNISMVLQKKGASELPNLEDTAGSQNFKNFAKNKVWLTGFILLNLKDIPFFIALRYGPLSLVTPMAGVGLIVLVFFTKYYLKENIAKPMYLGIIITIIGIIIIGVTSGSEENVYTWEENLDIVVEPKSIITIIVIIICMFLPAIISKLMGFKYADVLFALAAGFSIALGNTFSKIMVSGLPASLSQWQFYLTFAIMLGGNTAGVIFSQFGFQKGKAIIVAPIYSVCGIIIPSLVGIIMFNEFAGYDAMTINLKIIGFILTVIGVGILSFFNTKEEKSD
jgi:uncharacterized membrane protein